MPAQIPKRHAQTYAMAAVGSKQFWREFIVMYRSLPELWQVKSEIYRNRAFKDAAYRKLIAKLKQLDESADRSSVIKRINTLRGNYRRELKKVLQSERSGLTYVPTLWYYKEFDFLSSQECKEEQESEDDPLAEASQIDEEEISATDMVEVLASDFGDNNCNQPKNKCYWNIQACNTTSYKSDASVCSKPNPKCNHDRDHNRMSTNILEKAVSLLEDSQDYAQIFSKGWATEFRQLDDAQQLFAKRAIDEVLYQGRLGNLTPLSWNIHSLGSNIEEY